MNISLFVRISTALAFTSLAWTAAASDQSEPQPVDLRIQNAWVLYQRIMWVGSAAPADSETELLWTALQRIQTEGVAPNLAALEQFVRQYPSSPWAPSLLANLGRYYEERGRYTKALECWQAAWAVVHDEKSGPGKLVADFTLVYWTRLLSALGRVDEVGPLLEENKDRELDRGGLQQVFNATKFDYRQMRSGAEFGFRCGSIALSSFGTALNGKRFDARRVLAVPAPVTGFSMSKLLALAAANSLDVTAAKWGESKVPVLPSVVHWKNNHYAAILEKRNDFYRIADPVFGRPKWLRAEEIAEEASGCFIVPTTKLPSDWMPIQRAQADIIFGRGYVSSINEGNDGCANGSGGNDPSAPQGGSGSNPASPTPLEAGGETCHNCSSGSGAPSGTGAMGNSGSGTGGGGDCCGCPPTSSQGGNSGSASSSTTPPRLIGHSTPMATWQVSDPYVNVWLYDEPISYQPGLGYPISFKLSYKQRDLKTSYPFFPAFNFGKQWNCTWLSYIIDDEPGFTALVAKAGGGEESYDPTTGQRSFYGDNVLARSQDQLNQLRGFTITYSDGAKDHYGFVATNLFNTHKAAFLSAKVDRYGNTTLYPGGRF